MCVCVCVCEYIYIYIFTNWPTWEDVALGSVTVSSVKSTDVTCKTHLGYLAAQLP